MNIIILLYIYNYIINVYIALHLQDILHTLYKACALYTGAQAHCGSYVCVMQHRRPQSVCAQLVANATVIFKSGLVHYRLHLYNQSGVFYFPSSPGIDTR